MHRRPGGEDGTERAGTGTTIVSADACDSPIGGLQPMASAADASSLQIGQAASGGSPQRNGATTCRADVKPPTSAPSRNVGDLLIRLALIPSLGPEPVR